MAYILRETEASVIVCSSDALKKLNQIELQTLPSLMAAIVMDDYSDYKARKILDIMFSLNFAWQYVDDPLAHSNSIAVASFSAMVKTGRDNFTSVNQLQYAY